jgi:hypothetical protein
LLRRYPSAAALTQSRHPATRSFFAYSGLFPIASAPLARFREGEMTVAEVTS